MFKFTWRIENFCMLPQNTGEYIDSPIFKIKSLDNLKAFIRLYPKGSKSKNYISCYLIPVNASRKFDTGTKSKVSLTNNNHFGILEVEADTKGDFGIYSFERALFQEIDKYSNLFLFTDNLDIECIIQKPNSLVPTVTCYGKTVVQIETYRYDLALNDFPISTTSGEKLEYSENFSVEQFQDSFKFSVQKQIRNTVQLRKMCGIETAVFVCCKISLLNAKENTELKCDKRMFKAGSEIDFWDIPFDICESVMKKFVTLRCEIIVSKGKTVPALVNGTLPPTIKTVTNLNGSNANDKRIPFCVKSVKNCNFLCKNMFETKMFSNVILQVGTDQFPAHKCVLGSISHVFAAMFTNKMKEEETNVVIITDIDKDIVDKMLQFIYTGEVENLNLDDVVSLYSVADKYQILELKDLCSFQLSESLSMGTVLEVLVLADMHHDCALNEAARNFIYNNREEMLKTNDWKSFMKTNLQLAADIMFHICQLS